MKNFLSGVFRHAAQQGYFDGANPVKLAEVPAFAPNGAETKPYSLEEIGGYRTDSFGVPTPVPSSLRSGTLRSEISPLDSAETQVAYGFQVIGQNLLPPKCANSCTSKYSLTPYLN